MSEKRNPEPAFPRSEYGDHGMTLRDWFAGQALAGLTSNQTWMQNVASKGELVTLRASASAYEFADAMLQARSEGGAS